MKPSHIADTAESEQQTTAPDDEALQDVVVVPGTVWELSRDAAGSRAVQRAFDEAGSNEERAMLAQELRGHVWEALRCPHANHVLQKCIAFQSPTASKFIVDELMHQGEVSARLAARHRFGSRIMERLLEHCSPGMLQPLIEAILGDAVALCKHAFGNFVIQHILEHGTEAQRWRVARTLQEHAAHLGADGNACGVFRQAISRCGQEERLELVRAIVAHEGLAATMACSRHGHAAVKLVLQMPPSTEVSALWRQLSADENRLRTSRYGRLVWHAMEPDVAAANAEV